jgi:UDP-N-acetyl-D-galactosamine dehydrogenase
MSKNCQIGIIGLGYVGLPLATAFSRKFSVIGFDTNANRIGELINGFDRTNEIEKKDLKNNTYDPKPGKPGITYTDNPEILRKCNYYIVTVPTPVDSFNNPDFSPLISATKGLKKYLDKGDIVIYESTVYPGATEEICLPILEETGLKYNEDFFIGYSPERINPGDKEHTVEKILKIVSGSNLETTEKIKSLYANIIEAGVHVAPNIKVAEAAKVIENTQRDINIAFVNELQKLFDLLDINIYDVLEAAGTKWNFLKFNPGMVGGHCIGVDPYYLAHKAKSVNFNTELILSGRRTNDSMGEFHFNRIIKDLIARKKDVSSLHFLIIGFAFKENCPDFRNTGVIRLINEFQKTSIKFSVYDPLVDTKEVEREYGIKLLSTLDSNFDVVIVAQNHKIFGEHKFESQFDKAIVYNLKN